MAKILSLLKDIFMLKQDDGIKIGLTQLKQPVIKSVKKDVSIRSKDVKLSDLMRRAS